MSILGPIVAYVAMVAGIVLVIHAVGRRLPRGILAGLALLPLLLLARGFLSDQTLIPSDQCAVSTPWRRAQFALPRSQFLEDLTTQYLPWAKAVRDAWLAGELPWRDRWNGCGTPLASNGLSGAFSPFVLPLLVFPLVKAFVLLAAVKLSLSLIGMWLWLSELRVSRGAALFGAIAFSLSLAMFPWMFYVQSSVVCLWPWVLFALELLRDEPRRHGAFLLLTTTLCLLALQGHVESVAMGLSFAGLFLLGRWATGDLPEAPVVLRKAALAGAAALALSCFLLLPEGLAILASNRFALVTKPYWFTVLSWRPHGPYWPEGFLTTLFPWTLGDGVAMRLLPHPISTYPEMGMGAIGVFGVSCALLVLRPGSKRRAFTWSFVFLIVAGLGIASGTWPFAEIQGHLPPLRFMFPVRFLSWTALAGSALAALEIDRLARDLAASRRPAVFSAALAVTLGLVAAVTYSHFAPAYLVRGGPGGLRAQQVALAAACGGLALFGVLVAGSRGWRVSMLPYLLAVAAAVELSWQGLRQFEYGPSDELFPARPLIRFLATRALPFRVLGEGWDLFPNTNVFAGVEEVRPHDAVERRDYVEFLNATCGYPPANYPRFIENLNASALDFLNVRYLICRAGRDAPGEKWRPVYSGTDGTVFENQDVLPRVFAPDRIVLAARRHPSGGWVRDAFAEFGVRSGEVPAANDWRAKSWVLAGDSGEIENGRVEVLDYRERTNAASFHVRTAAPAILVASLVQDGGWRAFDEAGRPVETTLANGPFLALRVAAGDHRIRLSYLPPGLRLGGSISGAAAAALLVFAVLRLRSRRGGIVRGPLSPGAPSR